MENLVGIIENRAVKSNERENFKSLRAREDSVCLKALDETKIRNYTRGQTYILRETCSRKLLLARAL